MTFSEFEKYRYSIYSRPAGAKHFALTDLNKGTVGVGSVRAPRYQKKDLPMLQKLLEAYAIAYPGAVFQLRRNNGRHTVFSTGK